MKIFLRLLKIENNKYKLKIKSKKQKNYLKKNNYRLRWIFRLIEILIKHRS